MNYWRSKHGTCTTLSKSSYFEEEDKLGESINISRLRDLLNESAGEIIPLSVIKHQLYYILNFNSNWLNYEQTIHEEIGGSKFITIMTNNSCQLQEITTCWQKLPNGSIGKQIECPSHLLGITLYPIHTEYA